MSKVAKITVMIMALTILSKVLGLKQENKYFRLLWRRNICRCIYNSYEDTPTILFTAVGAAIQLV